MSSIIFAWELGNNYGHLSRMLPIARKLMKNGHHIAFIVKNLSTGRAVLSKFDIPIFQCPLPDREIHIGRDVASYSDILALDGFASADILAGMVEGWKNLYKVLRADVVIADHAPTALLAARVVNVKTVHIGDCFTVPPQVAPMPAFRACSAKNEVARYRLEIDVLSMINACLSGEKQPRVHSVSEALAAEKTLLLSVRELDPYRGLNRGNSEFLGKLPGLDEGMAARWTYRGAARIFVYLRFGPWIEPVFDVLSEWPGDVIACIPGMPKKTCLEYANNRAHIQFFDNPVCLENILHDCELAICHSGHGMTMDCLKSGVPLLTLPTQMEQLLTTNRIVTLGIGLGVLPHQVQTHFSQAFSLLTEQKRFQASARTLSGRYADMDPHHALRKVVNTIELLCV